MPWRIVRAVALFGLLYACVRMTQRSPTEASQPPKTNYRQKMKDMIRQSEWCRVYYKGQLFIVETDKLDRPLKLLAGQGRMISGSSMSI